MDDTSMEAASTSSPELSSPSRVMTTATEDDAKPHAAVVVVVTPERRPFGKEADNNNIDASEEETSTATTTTTAATATAKEEEEEAATTGRPPLTQEEWNDLFDNDRDFRLNCLHDWFYNPVLMLVWHELYYYPPDMDDMEWEQAYQEKEKLPHREALEKNVQDFLTYMYDTGCFTLDEMETYGYPDVYNDSHLKDEPFWDTPERFQNFLTVCQILSTFMIPEDLAGLVEEIAEEQKDATGKQVMEQVTEHLASAKKWHLEYYNAPWNTIFLDENERACSGDDGRCTFIIFPDGFTEEDYEKAWEADISARQSSLEDTKVDVADADRATGSDNAMEDSKPPAKEMATGKRKHATTSIVMSLGDDGHEFSTKS